jgi:HEAT repeat protein
MKKKYKVGFLILNVIIGLFLIENSSAQQDLKTLEDKRTLPAVRKGMINILVKKNETKIIPILIKILKDTKEDEGLRRRAITALGELKATEAVVPLGEVLKDGEDSFLIKPDIIQALQDIGGENAKRVLLESFLENLGNPDISQKIIDTLNKMKGRIPVEYLGPALMHDNPDVVRAALKFIKDSKDMAALPIMMPFILDKGDVGLKKEVLTIASELGGSEIIPALILRLDDKDDEIRAFIADLLNKLPPKTMKPFYYNELDKFIEKESDKKIKENLIKARKRLKLQK